MDATIYTPKMNYYVDQYIDKYISELVNDNYSFYENYDLLTAKKIDEDIFIVVFKGTVLDLNSQRYESINIYILDVEDIGSMSVDNVFDECCCTSPFCIGLSK